VLSIIVTLVLLQPEIPSIDPSIIHHPKSLHETRLAAQDRRALERKSDPDRGVDMALSEAKPLIQEEEATMSPKK
jgi:hypothetical protein